MEEKEFFKKVSQCRKTERGTLLGFSTSILSQNIKKLEKKSFLIFGKKSHNAEKLKGGTLWDFSTSILSQNIKKMQRGPYGEKNFPEKCLAVPKKIERGDPLVLPGMVCYAKKQ